MKKGLLLFLLLGCLLIANTAAGQTRPIIIDLGSLSDSWSYALDINNLGQVVGYSWGTGGSFPAPQAFLWTASDGMRELGGGYTSWAGGINDLGQIVGQCYCGTSPYETACLWSADGSRPCLDVGSGAAYDINNLGQIAGAHWTTRPPGPATAFLWTAEGGAQWLGTLGGEGSAASGVNDLGQVVGTSETITGASHAFLWTVDEGMQDLGTLGGGNSRASGINNLGQVVGSSMTASGTSHAFLWTAYEGMQDLGTLGGNGSEARGINNLGQVVGESETSSGASHAFLWTAVEGMQDLGTLGGETSSAQGINDLGDVVGASDRETGEPRAVLWRLLPPVIYMPLLQP